MPGQLSLAGIYYLYSNIRLEHSPSRVMVLVWSLIIVLHTSIYGSGYPRLRTSGAVNRGRVSGPYFLAASTAFRAR